MLLDFLASIFGRGGKEDILRFHVNSPGGSFRMGEVDIAVWSAKPLRRGVYFVKTSAKPEKVAVVFEKINPAYKVIEAREFTRPIRESEPVTISDSGVLIITDRAN